jgi:hypothetical protein
MNTNNNNNNNTEFATVYFKVAHTGQNGHFNIATNICIANFIETGKYIAHENFNIDRNLEIEIVEVGQNIPGIRGEDAPALELDFDTSLREKYNCVYTNLAFYIRVLQ